MMVEENDYLMHCRCLRAFDVHLEAEGELMTPALEAFRDECFRIKALADGFL
jgi:hypothetical protein